MRWSVEPNVGLVTAENPQVECGFEVGDWYSFLSLGRACLDAERTTGEIREDGDGFTAEHDVMLRTGSAAIAQRENFRDDGLDRTLELEPTSQVRLGDFVARFVFDASEFETATVAGHTFRHRAKNRYLQYPTNTVRLEGPQKLVSVHGEARTLPDGMVLVAYARDEPPDRWIVHIRAIALGSGRGFLRLYGGPSSHLNALDSAVDLLGLGDRLLYCRERASTNPYLPSALPFQYVEYVEIAPGDTVEIAARCRVEAVDAGAER